MEAIVTGGAGFIGSNLVERLAKTAKVTVLDSLHTGSLKNLDGLGAQVVVMDTKDIGKLEFEPDVIFHLGMYSSSPMFLEDRRLVGEVVQGAVAVFDYAVECGARVVFASTSYVYNGQPPPQREDMAPRMTDFYAESRLAVEALSRLYSDLYGLKSVGMRFFSVYGPREESKGKYANLVSQFIWDVRAGRKPVIYGDGTQERDFIYVDDVVDALLRASSSPVGEGAFNVGTGVSHSLNDLVKKISEHMGRSVEVEYVPTPIKNYVPVTRADTSKAERDLGFKARYSLDDGIELLLKRMA